LNQKKKKLCYKNCSRKERVSVVLSELSLTSEALAKSIRKSILLKKEENSSIAA
jgi:hypothetical protein